MQKSLTSLICCALFSAALFENALASGVFTPPRWLENGGIASDMSPEFYWEMELRKLARDFHPPEKRVAPNAVQPEASPEKAAGMIVEGAEQTMDAERSEFDDALRSGRIKPPDVTAAKTSHETARRAMMAAGLAPVLPLPAEFPSEFADYHRGAFAFRQGEAYFDEARTAWEGLLARPKVERHYRSVWAAFMLGKLALAAKDPGAVKWFQRTRELAKDGFADSLGLAADSYGWEARSEWKQGHDEAAAQLYLTQLALGDDSAFVSLKAVIPDRPSVEGVRNFGETPAKNATSAEVKAFYAAQAVKSAARLEVAARSPLLRRLETAHVLATETQAQIWSYGGDTDPNGGKPGDRCRNWLAILQKAGIKEIADADHLGWVAYAAGRYQEAANWLALAPPETAHGLWLKAKLQRRDGNLAEATKTMIAVCKMFDSGKARRPDMDSPFRFGDPGYLPIQSAAGDLAGLHLAQGEFIEAMDAFLGGGHWDDAAFLADRVLSADELRTYVDAHFPKAMPQSKPAEDEIPERDPANAIRWLLARRLIREDRYDDARAYFPAEQQAVLGRYVAALRDADNAQLPKPQRARALFQAAWIARYDGMEIMGTEEEPDGFVSSGAFSPGSVDTERTEGLSTYKEYDYDRGKESVTRKPVKIFIPATAEEKRRIAKSRPHPDNRFHYRWVASALAWKAAGLMADGSDELADVLNTGGSWIKDRDEKGGDKFVQAIEHRCAKTAIGRAVAKKHWFTDLAGPWSGPLAQRRAAAEK